MLYNWRKSLCLIWHHNINFKISFWYSKINISNESSRGGWWGFGTDLYAEISSQLCWFFNSADTSAYMLKFQQHKYHKLKNCRRYFCKIWQTKGPSVYCRSKYDITRIWTVCIWFLLLNGVKSNKCMENSWKCSRRYCFTTNQHWNVKEKAIVSLFRALSLFQPTPHKRKINYLYQLWFYYSNFLISSF